MDIKNLANNIGANRSSEVVKNGVKDSNPTTEQTTNSETDRVTLTDVLSQVRELEQRSKEVSVDNAERIATIKAAIQEGSYQPNAESIAKKLIQTEALFSKV